MSRTKRYLLWSDTHGPFEDKRAIDLVHKVAKEVDEIVIMGDFADCYAISAHDKDPNRATCFDEEAEYINGMLDRIERLEKPVVYIEGNHEYRLPRYLTQRAPALYNMVKLPKIFRIKERGWKWVPYMSSYKVGRMHLTHDVGFAGRTAHTKSRQDFEGNVTIAHTHRVASEHVGNMKGSSHAGMMIGWLGDKEQIDYMHKAKAAQWHLGFGLLTEDRETKNVHGATIPIIDYACVANGKLYEVKHDERRSRTAGTRDHHALQRPRRPAGRPST